MSMSVLPLPRSTSVFVALSTTGSGSGKSTSYAGSSADADRLAGGSTWASTHDGKPKISALTRRGFFHSRPPARGSMEYAIPTITRPVGLRGSDPKKVHRLR